MVWYSSTTGVFHSVLTEVVLSNMPLRGRATPRLQTRASLKVDGLARPRYLNTLGVSLIQNRLEQIHSGEICPEGRTIAEGIFDSYRNSLRAKLLMLSA
jgi:hypothetical protein